MAIRDLVGTCLRINDKIVIDKHANVITSNIYCDTVHSLIITPSISERTSMEGITVYGDLLIDPDNSLLVSNIRSMNGEIKIGSDVTLSKSLHVSDTITATSAAVKYIALKELLPLSEGEIDILGNITAIRASTDEIRTKIISSGSSAPISVEGGGLKLQSGSLIVPKTNDTTVSHINVYSSSTMSGTVMLATQSDVTYTSESKVHVRLMNPLITPSSFVIASVGRYLGEGLPIVQSSVCVVGSVDIVLTNVDASIRVPKNSLIPINYLII